MMTTSETMQSLPGRFQARLAGNLQAVIQFRLTGEDGGQWFMMIGGGDCSVHEGSHESPDSVITMRASDFVGINDGTVDPVSCFWGGLISLEGSVDAVFALPSIMGWL
ncbi:MAG: SCP2 sterol-binding domain-containing protein [Candidatus Promineifilaceae bacterium]